MKKVCIFVIFFLLFFSFSFLESYSNEVLTEPVNEEEQYDFFEQAVLLDEVLGETEEKDEDSLYLFMPDFSQENNDDIEQQSLKQVYNLNISSSDFLRQKDKKEFLNPYRNLTEASVDYNYKNFVFNSELNKKNSAMDTSFSTVYSFSSEYKLTSRLSIKSKYLKNIYDDNFQTGLSIKFKPTKSGRTEFELGTTNTYKPNGVPTQRIKFETKLAI